MPIGSPSARALVQEVESKIDFTVIPGISALESKIDLLGPSILVGISAIESKLDQWDLPAVDEMLSAIESKLDNTIIVDIDDIQTMLSAIESKIDLTVIPGISAIESKLDLLDLADVDEMLSAIESKIDLTVIADIDDLQTMMSAIESKIDLTLIRDLSAIESKLDADLPAIATIAADVAEGKLRAFKRTYGYDTTNETKSQDTEADLTTSGEVQINFPTGATKLRALVVASIKANNQTAAEHNIIVTLQNDIDNAGWADIVGPLANEALTLPEVDATADALTLVTEVDAFVTTDLVEFRFQVNSDNAAEVHYTCTFVLSVEYDFQ